MKLFFEYLSTVLIAFSYTFLIRNHVYFGVALGTGTLIMVLLNISIIKSELPKYNFSGKLIDGRSKGSNRHSSEIRQKIAEAINNDEGTVSIARKLNISRSSVQRFKKKYLSSN